MDGQVRNQPSDEALTRFLRFLIKTSVPRILAKQEQERKEVNQNANDQQRMASIAKTN